MASREAGLLVGRAAAPMEVGHGRVAALTVRKSVVYDARKLCHNENVRGKEAGLWEMR